ncbi:MAG: hypothetical protein K2H86_09255 [Muribaculaceae bacterium]|nr:hypothetical protein [Muribaculaceae bacterium]
MRKYIYIVFSLVMLMALGACSDDFSWNGIEVGEDEYLISFAVSDPDLVVLSGTRAEAVEPVDHITLVIFDGEDMVQDPITVYSDDTDNFVAQTALNGNGSIKLKRDKVQDGDWYLIANAHTQISNIFKQVTRNDGRLSKTEFLQQMSYKMDYDEGPFSATNKVMVGHLDDVKLTSGTQTVSPIVLLQRTYCQISVEVDDDKIPFRLCSARLSRISDTGDLTLSGDNKTLTDDDFTDNWKPVPADRTLTFTNNGNTVKYASTGAQIMQYSFPYTPKDNASNQEKIMMLVRGYFSKDDFDGVDECFYAIPLPEIEANHYYQIKIKGASESGASTPKGAENNPNGIIVTFEDMTDKIKNIMTDGTNVLAVQDTVVIATDGKPVNIPIKVRTAGENQPTITLTKKNTSANSAWLHGVDVVSTWTGQKISSTEESKNKLYNCLITGSVSADENKGSERAVTYTIKLEGTALTRDIVFLQEGNKDIKYVSSTNDSYPIKSLKLVIKRNGSVVQQIDNYLGYINPDVVDAAPSTQCAGIKPAQNGGRERNIGLHAPMPNGGAIYEYTFELRNGATITGNKLNYTFSDSDVPEGGTDKYSYVVTSDYITITYNNVTYTLDLYHTGFFHNNLYYEVFTQEDGEDGLYWLDRNLGATSSGVGVRTTEGVMSGTAWPYVGADAIGDYCGSSPSCPPGWGVPSYAQLRSLTTRAAFGISRRYINGTAYFAPAFQFDAIVDGQPQKISSYFPLGLKKTGSTYDGTECAGYYLTTTSSGTSGYFKTMQFTGMNVVAQNTNFDNGNAPKYTMSVRCCAGSYNPATDGTVYKCSVYGYTNVFMYYLNADGSKTPLTTWPGERIAMKGDLGRYHPFEITPTMNYDMSRLYVIFNIVSDDGEVTDSNVSPEDRNNRIGIKFVNNGKYSSTNTAGTERPGQKGNWTNASGDNTDYDSEEFRIKGKFNTWTYWPTTVPPTYSFTSKGNGIYEAKVVVATPGPFIIAQKDAGWSKNNYKEWKHDVLNADGTKIENNKTYTMYSGKGDDYNWRFDTAGTYTLTLNWKTKTFTVSIDDSGETTTVEKFRLKGNFNGLNWGNEKDGVSYDA